MRAIDRDEYFDQGRFLDVLLGRGDLRVGTDKYSKDHDYFQMQWSLYDWAERRGLAEMASREVLKSIRVLVDDDEVGNALDAAFSYMHLRAHNLPVLHIDGAKVRTQVMRIDPDHEALEPWQRILRQRMEEDLEMPDEHPWGDPSNPLVPNAGGNLRLNKPCDCPSLEGLLGEDAGRYVSKFLEPWPRLRVNPETWYYYQCRECGRLWYDNVRGRRGRWGIPEAENYAIELQASEDFPLGIIW